MSALNGSELVRGLQERAARALPAEQIEMVEGWWLRHAPGVAWWVGTVLPHGDAEPGQLARRVIGAEKFCVARGATPRFQISPPACPEELDDVLAERGYSAVGKLSLQVALTARVVELEPTGSLEVRLDDRPTRAWFEVWRAVHGQDTDSDAEWAMLGRVERPCAYAVATVAGEVLSVGRAVADGGWTGVFGMATLPRARGSGAGSNVLVALAHWAVANRADHLYLQVAQDNVSAIGLYGRAGFTELCEYHYRSAR